MINLICQHLSLDLSFRPDLSGEIAVTEKRSQVSGNSKKFAHYINVEIILHSYTKLATSR